MFSKFTSIPLLVVLIFSSLISCSDFLRGRQDKEQVIELTDEKFVCLRDLPETLKKFSVGDGNESEIESRMNCLQESLRYFNKRTKGSVENAYTTEDMRAFFGRYFLKENNLSPELASGLMRIKRSMVGGSDMNLSKPELARLIDYIGIVKAEMLALNQHMKVLIWVGKPGEKKEQIQSVESANIRLEQITAATEQLRISMRNLLKGIEIANSDITFEETKKVLSSLAKFIQGPKPLQSYEDLAAWLPVIEGFKNVFLGQNLPIRGEPEWRENIDTTVDLYAVVMFYRYQIKSLTLKNPGELRLLRQFVTQFLSVLEHSRQMRLRGGIPIKEIDNLLKVMMDKKLIKPPVSMRAIQEAYTGVAINMLDPTRKGSNRGFTSIDITHINSLKREFNLWQLIQVYIDSLPYDERGDVTLPQLIDLAETFDYEAYIAKVFQSNDIESNALKMGWLDWLRQLKSDFPLNYNKRDRLMVTHRVKETKWTWRSLSQVNVTRGMARFLLLGYGEGVGDDLKKKNISPDSLNKWYSDFRTFGLETKAFDPRVTEPGIRSTAEADFFLFSSDGSGQVGFMEATEYVNYLISVGIGTAGDIRDIMSSPQFNCTIDEIDVFNFKKFDEVCFKRTLRLKAETIFANMPGMAKYIAKLNNAEWEKFYGVLMEVSRSDANAVGRIETADIRTLAMILHYVETTLVTFDKNEDGVLQMSEVEAAYPRFQREILKRAPVTWNWVGLAAFKWLLQFGDQLKGEDPGIKSVIDQKLTDWLPVKDGVVNRTNILYAIRALKPKASVTPPTNQARADQAKH